MTFDLKNKIVLVTGGASGIGASVVKCLLVEDVKTAVITSNLEAWEMMRKDKGGAGGTIINLSSIVALSKTVNVPIYSATKAAVLKFGTSIGDESHYLRSGVRVLTVCCGTTLTPLIENTVTKCFDTGAIEGLLKDKNKFKTQSPESAAIGIIQTYKQGKSGSVWIVTSGKPAVDVTDIYNESYALFGGYAYN